MRFHFGLSFRPKFFLKYILLGLLGLLAFFGISKVNAAEISPTEISAGNGTNNYIYCNSNFSSWCPSSFNPYSPPYTEYAPIKYINFDFVQTLTANHDYTFDIVFEVARPVSLNDFEQESYTFWSYTGSQLNDTTIIWTQQSTYDYQTGIYYSNYHYRGQFSPSVSSNGFYTRFTLEQNESVYGIIILSVQLVDNDSGDALINANYENTQNIINNNNSNTQSVINNQNQNTQSIIDNQKDLNLTCQNKFFMSPRIKGEYYSSSNGSTSSNSDYSVSQYFYVDSNTNYNVNFNNITGLEYGYLCWYNNDNLVSCSQYRLMSGYGANNFLITSPSNVNKLSLTYKNGSFAYITGNLCMNNSDIQNQTIQNNTESIEQLNDTITDETLPDIDDSTFGDLEISSETAISDLITMPITILRALNNNLGNTCTPYTIPFGLTGGSQTLTFPCIQPEEYLGSTIWNYIDLFICFFMVYNIAMLIISSFESITSLEDTFNSLYEPRHADTGYKPKHGGD